MTDEFQRLMRLAKIAELYYRERWTQSRIGDRLGLSTMQISRLLKDAEAAGVVEIRINHPLPLDEEVGSELKEAFDLGSVTALKVRDTVDPKREVALAGSFQLLDLLEPGGTLAVAWSSTLALLAHELSPTVVEGLSVVQMIGALTLEENAHNPYDVVREFGAKLGAKVHTLHAPTLLRSKEAREALVNDPAVSSVLDRARTADCAVCGIGAAGPDSTFMKLGYLSHDEYQELRERGVVGDVLGHLIDAQGEPLTWSYGENLVSVSLEDMRKIPRVLAVAAGASKARVILAALRGGYVSDLVTDAETARAVLSMASEEGDIGNGAARRSRRTPRVKEGKA